MPVLVFATKDIFSEKIIAIFVFDYFQINASPFMFDESTDDASPRSEYFRLCSSAPMLRAITEGFGGRFT